MNLCEVKCLESLGAIAKSVFMGDLNMFLRNRKADKVGGRVKISCKIDGMTRKPQT